MKNPLIISALASLLMICSNSAFSDEMLHDMSAVDKNCGSKSDIENCKKFIGNIKKCVLLSEMNGAIKRGSSVKFSGNVVSYGWYSSDASKSTKKFINNTKLFDVDIGGNIEKVGTKHDGILSLRVESNPDKCGIMYGIHSEVNIPNVAGRSFNKHAAFNRGSRVFAKTPYGDFSAGYQEGMESVMKLDAFDIAAGDNYNIWTKHLRGIVHEKKADAGYLLYNFNFNPGLYSESVFRDDDNLVFNNSNHDASVGIITKDFINNLPFRLSYQSQNFMGLKFGISYSPVGYNQQLFEFPLIVSAEFVSDVRKIEGDKLNVSKEHTVLPYINNRSNTSAIGLIGPVYKNIISGGISYTYNIKNVKFSTSIIGEYGNEYIDDDTKLGYVMHYVHQQLNGISIGFNVSYDNLKLAGAYGNLGTSGIVKKVCYTFYSNASNCHEQWQFSKNTNYYWNLGIAYQREPLNFSIIYFESSKLGNKLKDISVGVQYNVLKYNSFKNSLFVNYNYYIFNQMNYVNGIRNKPIDLSGKGYVLLAGIKSEF
ncbi:porin [Ehrlichia canis]|uniref:porin n=1 Tax=Ehrlichia canis TaxID=944 RepID=UPI000C828D82|nr:porin [Ehrlichia canis]AUO54714.1 hypothetical protein C1I72_02275 [Ehrlichia canis]UKC53079.1 porin [Ehrlichia canis]UKC54016.1 porin [Ehrlichia canis]UKC54952.1 porin [Ehrlichia canis]